MNELSDGLRRQAANGPAPIAEKLYEAAEAIESLTDAWDMTHFSCDNPDHSEAYKLGAKALGYPSASRPVDFVDIVFDGAPSHEGPRFIEVENPERASVRLGEWLQREDGHWVLRIPTLQSSVAQARAEQRERDAQIALTTTSAPLHTPWGAHVAHQIRTQEVGA